MSAKFSEQYQDSSLERSGDEVMLMENLEGRRLLAASALSTALLGAGSNPEKVIKGLDGSIYVYEQGSNQLARLRPGAKSFTRVAIPASNDQHFGMALSQTGDVYFTVANGIGAYSPKFNTIKIIPLSTAVADIAPGSDGNLWFTEPDATKVGRLTLANNKRKSQFAENYTITEFDVPTNAAGVASITRGPGQTLWFGEDLVGGIGQIDLSSGSPVFSEYALPAGAGAHAVGITTGPDGNVWFAEVFANKIGKINVKTKQITEYTVPTPNSNPFWLTTGSDGNLWFVERATGKVARITTNGDIKELTVVNASNHSLTSIVRGPGKTLWFTAADTDVVGILNLGRKFTFDSDQIT